jgi:hypothetical protein
MSRSAAKPHLVRMPYPTPEGNRVESGSRDRDTGEARDGKGTLDAAREVLEPRDEPRTGELPEEETGRPDAHAAAPVFEGQLGLRPRNERSDRHSGPGLLNHDGGDE